MFQNHYGWIETNKGKVEVLLYKQFQNHYGWIETAMLNKRFLESSMFQNHYGWIETCYHSDECGWGENVSKPLRLD